ncbi:MAG: winged helix-turn-helix transcriptional regulator [Bauldia sp.]|nr:winged helix-turn-helix transcriptional regulator [Bauldia sp.]
MASVEKVFEALASAHRRRILAYLSKTDMTAGEIGERFAGIMSQPAISKHLSVLEHAGVVWRQKRGMNVHYGLNEDALSGTLVHFLAEVCPVGRPLKRESAAAARRKRVALGEPEAEVPETARLARKKS